MSSLSFLIIVRYCLLMQARAKELRLELLVIIISITDIINITIIIINVIIVIFDCYQVLSADAGQSQGAAAGAAYDYHQY